MNEDAYTPCAVSIGPLHHGRKGLELMEKQKLRYFREFISQTRISLHDLVCFIKDMEHRIRNCYQETFLINSEEFVKMILTDATFIIPLLDRWCNSDQHDEFLFRNSCLMSSICGDIMLLENQLPFFFLEKLYNLYVVGSKRLDTSPSFLQLTCYFFKGLNRDTDLLRLFHLPPPLTFSKRNHPEGKVKLLYSASELYDAGVNIKVGSSRALIDCRLYVDGAVFQIPRLVLNDLTTSLLQNLMALELFHYPGETCISDYISLMGYLMETTKDVDLLVQKKILDNGLGDSNEVVAFFNKLGRHIAVDRYCDHYNDVSHRLNIHCEQRWLKPKYHEHRWQNWLAILKVEYFSTPWRSASTIAAIILLVLTLIQTVFAIIK